MNEGSAKIRLLFVDDEEEFLAATAKVLGRRDMEVITALSGEQALEILRDWEVDVVVLDMKMPGMGGAKAFERIKDRWPRLPVIVLTGHESLTEACRMTREGVFDYLLKPCDTEALADLIREAVARTGREVGPTGEDAVETVRLLLVDDERPLLETLKKVLARRSMEVHTAESGDEALAILDRTPIDVVVLDVKMPGLNGLELLRRIKAGPVDREVILLTGHPTVTAALTGVKEGAFEYLMKPPDIAALADLIREAHRQRKEKRARQQEKTVRDILRRYPD